MSREPTPNKMEEKHGCKVILLKNAAAPKEKRNETKQTKKDEGQKKEEEEKTKYLSRDKYSC